VELAFPSHRCLLVSGTASIAPDGRTVHRDDHAGQIGLTMQVVTALLRARGMDGTDVTRGIAYFTEMADRALLDRYCREQGIPQASLAVAHAAICRDDLLYEIEVDAVKL
jgi:enamine deaminase RidA (YjgF/YER057c/UK114 family)